MHIKNNFQNIRKDSLSFYYVYKHEVNILCALIYSSQIHFVEGTIFSPFYR